MDRKKFGKLIIALRREHHDQYFTSWTRQRFAEESGIDQEILANIETGRRAILYPDLLVKMADALKLTSGERREFFLAASGIDEKNIYNHLDSPKTLLEEMLTIMDDIQQPAVLVDQFFDIIAINLMMLEVYNITVDNFLDANSNSVTRFNLIRFLFSPEFDAQMMMFGPFRKKFAKNMIMLFRAASLRYRETDYFQNLYKHLHQFDDFKTYIQYQHKLTDDHYVDNNMSVTLDNPRLGSIRAISTSVTTISTAGELKLFAFTPLSDETAKIFANLAQQGDFVFQSFPNWPDKKILAKK